MNSDRHVSLRDFFNFFNFFNFFKCSRVNLAACHVSKSMFYIQFGHIFIIFVQFSPNCRKHEPIFSLSKLKPNLIFILKFTIH